MTPEAGLVRAALVTGGSTTPTTGSGKVRYVTERRLGQCSGMTLSQVEIA
jgi:hypothetical protein